jgi:hypothetical protein
MFNFEKLETWHDAIASADMGQLSGGWQAEEMVENTLRGVWGWVKVRLMTGKAASAARSCWPIIPKRGDRQVCLITSAI